MKYFLKAKNVIRPLKNICCKNTVYQGLDQLITNYKSKCEEDILTKDKSSHCIYTKIKNERKTYGNHSGNYLAVLSNEEKNLKSFKIKNEITKRKHLKNLFGLQN